MSRLTRITQKYQLSLIVLIFAGIIIPKMGYGVELNNGARIISIAGNTRSSDGSDSDRVSSGLMVQYDDRINLLERNLRELRGQIELLNNTKQQWQRNLDHINDKLDKLDDRLKKIDRQNDMDGQIATLEERLALLEKISQKFYESLNGITERMVSIEDFIGQVQSIQNKNNKEKPGDNKSTKTGKPDPNDKNGKASKPQASLAELLAENTKNSAKSSAKSVDGKNTANKGEPPAKSDSKSEANDKTNNSGASNIVLKPATDPLKKIYQSSIDALNQGEYSQAESGFKKIIKEFPDFTVTPNSYYWLGEVYYLKNDWSRAAKQFFTTYQKFPTASKAADSLYRLGLTLHELHKYDESCSALARVAVEFPKSSNFIRQGAADAMNRFNCTER